MQYGQIVFLLFIAMLLYYAALIVLDIQRAKAAQASEQDRQAEVDIDISDEARTFRSVRIYRDEPDTRQQNPGMENGSPVPMDEETASSDTGQDGRLEEGKQFHRPGYREAIMTDGILVEDIIKEVDKLAETGTSDLGTVIYNCENARLQDDA